MAAEFHWADYFIMTLMLLASMATGAYFARYGMKSRTVEEYLLAGRKMHVVPVAFSTFVTWMSGISFLADPVECYKYGAIYFLLVLGQILSAGIAAPFAAKIHRLKVLSLYEFLEKRYNRALRVISSVCIMISLILWLGIATYAPSLALSQVSGIPVWGCIVLLGSLCTLYVPLGGMKAVIWVDSVQLGVMVAGMIAVVIQGSLKVGGMANVFTIAAEGGRINFKESVTNFNPLVKASLWTYFFGGLFRVCLEYISAQHIVQRYCTVPTEKDARNVSLVTMPLFAVMSTLIGLCGMVMYATYADCDPLLSGQVERMDQLVPHLVLDILGFLPGIPGLFMAAVFSGSISSISSGMNSISALCLSDIVEPLHIHSKGRPLEASKATNVARLIALVSGFLITAFAFLTSILGESIFRLNTLLNGAFFGPVAGIVFIALMFPKIQTLPVNIAYIVSIACTLGLGMAAQILPKRGPWELLPLSDDGCPGLNNMTYGNGTTLSTVTIFEPSSANPTIGAPGFRFEDLYQLNSLLYAPLGFFLALTLSFLLEGIFGLSAKLMGVSRLESRDKDGKRDLDLQAIQESDHFLKQTATKDEAGDAIVEQTIEFPVV